MPEESTSPDLAQLAQGVVDAMNAREFDAAASFYASAAVLDAEGAGIHGGRDAIRRFYEDWWDSYEDHQQEIEETCDFGNGVILAVILMHGHLPGAAESLRQRYTAVATWSNGLIERQSNYTDIDEARAAAERFAEERG